jgi:hypothetical protein
VDMVGEGIRNGSRNLNRENEDIQDYHRWQGSTST